MSRRAARRFGADFTRSAIDFAVVWLNVNGLGYGSKVLANHGVDEESVFMKIFKLLALGAVSIAVSACSNTPTASSMVDGMVAINVSTLNEAPVPKPETQQMAEQQCGGSATYLATENVNPFKARHVYRCGAGGNRSYGSVAATSSGNVNAGYSAYGSAPAVTSGGVSDGGVSSTDLAPM